MVRIRPDVINPAHATGWLLALLLGGALGFPVRAAGSGPEEIRLLLAALNRSDCRFQRNGSWHSAAEASEHLATKLLHVSRWRPIASAEEFVRDVASRSSQTNRDYMVQCPSTSAVPAQAWLLEQLARIRRAS